MRQQYQVLNYYNKAWSDKPLIPPHPSESRKRLSILAKKNCWSVRAAAAAAERQRKSVGHFHKLSVGDLQGMEAGLADALASPTSGLYFLERTWWQRGDFCRCSFESMTARKIKRRPKKILDPQCVLIGPGVPFLETAWTSLPHKRPDMRVHLKASRWF